MASGDFLDISQWAARTARFDVDTTADMTLAKAAVNDAYLSSCGTGDPFDFLQAEGQWTCTAGSDVYAYSSIATAMSISGATIAEIETLVNDSDGQPLQSMGWAALEGMSYSTQDDDGNGEPLFWSKWASRIRLYPTPDATYTLGAFVRLAPSEMTADADTPLIPLAWRRRLLVPYAAAILLRTEGGLETAAEANRLMEGYERDYVAFRTAYATAKKPTFRLMTPVWEAENPVDHRGATW